MPNQRIPVSGTYITLHVAALAFMVIALGSGNPRGMFAALAIVVPLLAWNMWHRISAGTDDPFDVDSTCAGLDGIDPWDYQRTLMEKSDQHIPDRPTLTSGGLLYGALIMEETGETYTALKHAIWNGCAGSPSTELKAIAQEFGAMGSRCKDISAFIRRQLAGVTLAVPLARDDAIELFDGTTDIQVVNSGFSLALGLPGAQGYEEVASSNLSKQDPTTHKIEKDASGKWIKGPNYRKPDLARVLAEHAG